GPVVVERGRVPEREVGVGGGAHARGIRGVMDVEQQPVPAAGTASKADGRIHRDIVTLRRAAVRTEALPSAIPFDAVRDDAERIVAKRGAVGPRRGSRAAPRLDDAVERRRDELVAEDDVAAFERDDVAAGRARGINFLLEFDAVFWSVAVPLRRGETLENARRADDMRLLGMRQRDLDDLDPEQRSVRRRIDGADRAAGQLVG